MYLLLCYTGCMAKGDKNLSRFNNEDEANKKLNLGAAMFGFADPSFQDVVEPKPVEEDEFADSFNSGTFGPGWQEIVAPTKSQTDSKGRSLKTRTLACGWHKKTETLVVVFRPPGITKQGTYTVTGNAPWVYYDDVTEEMWDELSGYHSTGEWLKYSGVEYGHYERVPGDDKIGLANIIKSKLIAF